MACGLAARRRSVSGYLVGPPLQSSCCLRREGTCPTRESSGRMGDADCGDAIGQGGLARAVARRVAATAAARAVAVCPTCDWPRARGAEAGTMKLDISSGYTAN